MRKPKIIYGKGINDVNDYVNDNKGYRCPFYERWVSMLKRCYSLSWLNKYPTYKGCSVCKEWLTFSNFKSWMEQQDWKGCDLDKDLLVKGNKVYSPETCCFIPKELNVSLQYYSKSNNLLGVICDKRSQIRPFIARIQDQSICIYLGCYATEIEAHRAWQAGKINSLKRLSRKFQNFKDSIELHIQAIEEDLTQGRITCRSKNEISILQ